MAQRRAAAERLAAGDLATERLAHTDKDPRSLLMAGNVITTCLPPTSTTTSTVTCRADGHWSKDLRLLHQSSDPTPRAPQASPPTSRLKSQVNRVSSLPTVDQNVNGKVHGPQERLLLSPKKTTVVMKENAIYQQNKVDGESSEASEGSSSSKPRPHRKDRRSLKETDIQTSLLKAMDDSLDVQASHLKAMDDSKSDLQRSESDGNQNSAPECDLSISGSPFKELDFEQDKKLDSNPDLDKKEDLNPELHRNSPPVKDEPNAQWDLTPGSGGHHKFRAKTKSDPLDQRRDRQKEYSVLSSPNAVMRFKSGASSVPVGSWEDKDFARERQEPSTSWYKTPDNSSSGKSLLGDSSSKESTSDSQDDQMARGNRFVVYDSKRHSREWRTALSESYRDQDLADSTWTAATPSADGDHGKVEDAADSDKKVDYPLLDAADDNLDPEQLRIRSSALQRDLAEVMASRDDKARENATLRAQLERSDAQLRHAKEALTAMKADRKRLKAEKFELLTQMKQLYSTLEDKEAELRQFIRSYTQKVRDSDHTIKQLRGEREGLEQEKWAVLQRARDESERAVLLATQLGLKDSRIRQLQDQIQMLDKHHQVSPTGNGFGSPVYAGANGLDSQATTTPSASPEYSPPGPLYADPSSPRKGASAAESPERGCGRPGLLSRSAEDVFAAECGARQKKKEKKGGTWGSISRVFSRNKKRKPLHPHLFHSQRASWSPNESVYMNSEEVYSQQVRHLEESRGTPMQHWKAATVLAWLRVTMEMPHYAAACAQNIKSGKLLLELSDSELEEGLCITNSMHRRKLRLAIEEHRQPSLCRYPKICLMSHPWVLDDFLPSIALSCYRENFQEHLVDGRVLDTLTKRDLEKHFGISRKFHQLSIMHAIQLLRILNFDRQVLEQRRMTSETVDLDPLVWSNGRLQRWALGVELGEYAENLRNTGVHGALAVLEPSFTAETMATALGIPPSKNILRRHLTTEWNNLIQPARLSLESESAVCRRAERRGLSSGGSSVSLSSQGGRSSVASYARRTIDRCDRRRASWRESLRSLTSRNKAPAPPPPPERPQVLSLSPKISRPRHRRTLSAHSDVTETLTVTPV